MNGDPVLFRSQVKYYWWVDARPFQKEEDDMTQEEFQRLAGEYLEQLLLERQYIRICRSRRSFSFLLSIYSVGSLRHPSPSQWPG